jgi:hypothetical protein
LAFLIMSLFTAFITSAGVEAAGIERFITSNSLLISFDSANVALASFARSFYHECMTRHVVIDTFTVAVDVSEETLQHQYILVIVDIYVKLDADLMHKFILTSGSSSLKMPSRIGTILSQFVSFGRFNGSRRSLSNSVASN